MIYKDFFKARLKSSIIYTLIIIVLSLAWMGLYNSFNEESIPIYRFLEEIDPRKLEALDIDLLTLFEPLHFYSFFLTFGIIVYSLFAVNLAIEAILEDGDKERLMLVKPLKRTEYLKKRIYISIGILLMSHVLIFLSLYIFLLFFNVENLFFMLFLIQAGLFLSQIAIFSLVLMIATFIPDFKLINLLGIMLVMFFVVFEIIYRITDFKLLAYLNPLCYFDTSFTLEHHRLSFDYLIAIVALCFFSLTFTFNEYESREVI